MKPAKAPAAPESEPAGICPHTRRTTLLAVGGLLGLTLAMFAGVLFGPADRVLSGKGTDLFHAYVHWRQFGFDELRHGTLALWNPHYCFGAPFFGGFQAALLYPLNVLYLILPLGPAVNWTIALHIFLAGVFTYGWAAYRGLRPLACFLAAAIFMFCGAHFPHIYAGHLSNLCSLIWMPLLFLAIDGTFDRPSVRWSLLGMTAMAMQILAGHPQYVFYTGVAAGIYCGLCWLKARERKRTALGLAAIVAGGIALTAVQLFTGIQEGRETLRSAGVNYDFAAMFSLPPENLVTFIAPGFFGSLKDFPYWGRCYLWEMSLFISVAGLLLAVVGAIWGERSRRRFCGTMIVVLAVLALGSHTPLFKLLYHWVPGFSSFRGNSKFIALMSLFLALLAGIGLDGLLRGRRVPNWFGWGSVGLGALVIVLALVVHGVDPVSAAQEGSGVQRFFAMIQSSGETEFPAMQYRNPAFITEAAAQASGSLLVGAICLLLAGGLTLAAGRFRPAVPGLAALAIIELFFFARGSLATFNFAETTAPGIKAQLEKNPGDYRIFNPLIPNVAMIVALEDFC